MTVRVVVVDDSGFFRRRIIEILQADIGITVVGTAANGREALEVIKQYDPDVVTMDIEMPIMDGITAVRRLMTESPRPVLMFSTLTTDGAKATLDALDAGATDFLPKRFADIAADEETAKVVLRRRVRALARSRRTPSIITVQPSSPARSWFGEGNLLNLNLPSAPRPAVQMIKVILIGTSTGGPVALQEILKVLPKSFSLPIILIQHMPASFTPSFADRLNHLCQIEVREAVSGDLLRPGCALLAPGGRQLILDHGSQVRVKIEESPPGTIYKPSVDLTFRSAVKVFKGNVLAIILTGMGSDGREGARMLKEQGAQIWAQDATSSIVFGMPAAVIEAGLADLILDLKEVGPTLVKNFG